MKESYVGKTSRPIWRIRVWYALLLFCVALFVVRLFYLQVIRHGHYESAALRGQLKEYEIPAERGVIEAHNGSEVVPIVLNETLYTLFADPVYIKDADGTATKITELIGGDKAVYAQLLKTPNTRYVVLKQRMDKATSEKIDALEIKGLGTRGVPYRTYPQGDLASQLLGFVNNEGEGKYGIEQALDSDLKGVPGRLKAITDASGVPLAANLDNVNISPQPGKRLTLTIDIAMQHQLEAILKSGLNHAKSKEGSAVIIDPRTGAIKAMANFPTYSPAEYYKVEDGSRFNNAAVSNPIEVASVMKPLVAAAALDLGVVNASTTYEDHEIRIGDATVMNVQESRGGGTKSVRDILRESLNTGSTWLLMQMGGGELNSQARIRWHDYMTNRFQLGKMTGVEQGFEAAGSIPEPNEGYGLEIRYANTTFGQGMTATLLQMAAASGSVVNGGTYYKPHLVEKVTTGSQAEVRKPVVVQDKVVSRQAGLSVKEMLEYAYSNNRLNYGSTQDFPQYGIGGKTGTAEIAMPEGGYYKDRFNGTYVGFVGGDEAEYVIAVMVITPKIPGYAGTKAAAPIFVDLAAMLINNFGVTPKR